MTDPRNDGRHAETRALVTRVLLMSAARASDGKNKRPTLDQWNGWKGGARDTQEDDV